MKKSLFTAVAVGLGLTASLWGQNNCNLINSITLSVPNSTFPAIGPNIGCVNTNNPPNNASTQVFESIPPNVWSQLTLTKSSTNECKLYLNGSIIFSGSYANINYVWNSLKMGAAFGNQYYNHFKGYIDEVRLSNVVRTASEIQTNFINNVPLSQDANTIGLWHFDQSSGTIANSIIGASGSIFNAVWSSGYFNNCLYYNGSNAYVNFNMPVPTSSFTIEAWVKPDGLQGGTLFQPYGINNADFLLYPYTASTNYTWSTGANGNSLTVNPTQMPYVWVTDGNCTDTVWFDSQSATIYDTVTTNVTVYDTLLTTITDTLIINTTLSLPAPNNENTILIYPNPASDHITIDNGNFAAMAGYSIKIENNAGQQVFQSAINQQQFYVDLSTWTGNGLYFVHLIDAQNNTVTVRKIVLQ